MHLAVNGEELGKEWVEIVRSCCPNVTAASSEVRRGDVVITAGFEGAPARCRDKRRRAVEIIVGAELVEAYLGASMLQRTYSTTKLVECVLTAGLDQSSGPPDDVDCASARALTHADLGMAAEPANRQLS